MNMLHYKNYYGSIEFDPNNLIFYGQVQFIRGLISYEGASATELKQAFEEAIDDYLETCQHRNIKPETPFKGSLNVRLGHELHREAALNAEKNHISLNRFICDAISQHLSHA